MKSKQMKFAKPGKKLWSDTNNIMKQMFLRGFAPRNPLVGPVDCLPACLAFSFKTTYWHDGNIPPKGATTITTPALAADICCLSRVREEARHGARINWIPSLVSYVSDCLAGWLLTFFHPALPRVRSNGHLVVSGRQIDSVGRINISRNDLRMAFSYSLGPI